MLHAMMKSSSCCCFKGNRVCSAPVLRFVSDHGPQGYDAVCQHALLQAMQRCGGGDYTRTYPPCLLEWIANRKRAHTLLHVHCFDGTGPQHSTVYFRARKYTEGGRDSRRDLVSELDSPAV